MNRFSFCRSSSTARDYLKDIRNSLYSIDEKIWLHDYCKQRPEPSVIGLFTEEKYNRLKESRLRLLKELPLSRLMLDIKYAQYFNLFHAASFLRKQLAELKRKVPQSLQHVNSLAVLRDLGENLLIVRGEGIVLQELSTLENAERYFSSGDTLPKFNCPTFSSSNHYLSVSCFNALQKEDACRICIFSVPQEPREFSSERSLLPILESPELPFMASYLRFSPSDDRLFILSNNDRGSILYQMDWRPLASMERNYGYRSTSESCTSLSSDSCTQTISSSDFLPWYRSISQGNRLFFDITSSNPKNASLVIHRELIRNTSMSQSYQLLDEVVVLPLFSINLSTNALDSILPRSLYEEMLNSSTECSHEHLPKNIIQPSQVSSTCDSMAKLSSGWSSTFYASSLSKPFRIPLHSEWHAPQCHQAGGGDNVLYINNQQELVSHSLSRWKRNVRTGELPSKVLLKNCGSHCQFVVSLDSSLVAAIKDNKELLVWEGEDLLDPLVTPSNCHLMNDMEGKSHPSVDYDNNGSHQCEKEVPMETERLKVGNHHDFSHHNEEISFSSFVKKAEDDLYGMKSIVLPPLCIPRAIFISPDSRRMLLFNERKVMDSWSSYSFSRNYSVGVYSFRQHEFQEYSSFVPDLHFAKNILPFFSQYAKVRL